MISNELRLMWARARGRQSRLARPVRSGSGLRLNRPHGAGFSIVVIAGITF